MGLTLIRLCGSKETEKEALFTLGLGHRIHSILIRQQLPLP